ncbi:MAG: D-2-hydroxyacid dehydrogenase [Oscillospiraceae bacterium]|nr:D-2-hydroxyacid dehydrogenase [Oscillospiraceae bacterium]
MRKIAVCIAFSDDSHRHRINTAATELGFTVDYYDTPEAMLPAIADYEIIYGHPAPEIVRQASNLRWMCSDFAGIEKYLEDSVWPHPDCLLSNSSGAYGPTISEHIIMVLLMLLRRMPEYSTDLNERKWTFYAPICSIIGSHILLLGTGDIGSNTARRLKALGASVTGVCRSGISAEPAFDRVVSLSELDSVLPTADALVMSLPATSETIGILSRERIALLPKHAYVVNVGRGSAIDQEALVEALNSRSIAGAALDVMMPEPLPCDHPLWECPNTILTPHVSGNLSLGLTCDLDIDMFLADLRRYHAGEPLANLVDRKRGY